MTIWERVKLCLPAVLIFAPTIIMIFWGRHHLPDWWYRLLRPVGLPWVSDFDRQLVAVVAVFTLTMFVLFVGGLIWRFFGRNAR